MKRGSSVVKRVLAVVLAAVIIVGSIPGDMFTLNVKAATTGNALKAIGIDTDKMPEGFDEDDDYSNPYGKQTITWKDSDEVLVATMGKDGSAVIGNNVTTVVGSKNKIGSSSENGGQDGLITYKDDVLYYTDDGTGVPESTTYISDVAVAGCADNGFFRLLFLLTIILIVQRL